MAPAAIALAITEVLAVLAARRYFSVAMPPETGPGITAEFSAFLFAFALGTLLIVALLRFTKNRIVFEALFTLALFFGVLALAEAFVSVGAALLLAAAVTLLRMAAPRVIVQNSAVVLGVAGIAFAVGISVSPVAFAILLAVLAVYDIVAVYGTHHMITMMRGLMARGVVAALLVPSDVRRWTAPVSALTPGEDAHLLGTGDLALPAIFVVSTLRDGMGPSLGAALGSLLGLAATQFIFLRQRHHRPMPALPPIATGTLIGYFIARLVV